MNDATPSESSDEPVGADETPSLAGGRRLSTPARALVAAAVLIVGAGAVLALRQPPERPDGLVVLYGDSLSFEAYGAFDDELARTSDAEVLARVEPGTSPCDVLETMVDDAALEPAVVVVQYVGNNHSECMLGPGGEQLAGRALADRTEADVRAATEIFATQGTRVVLVAGPVAPGLPGDPDLADAYNGIVNEWAGRDLGQVRYADAAATVTGPDHGYVDRLPCRDDEGGAQGCVDGEVVVRSPDRIHFCPRGGDGLACSVPAPGARRFGEEMARVVRLALDPDL